MKREFTRIDGAEYFGTSEAYSEDGGRTWRWVSNDAFCPVHSCADYGIPCDVDAQSAAVSEQAGESIDAYMRSREEMTDEQRQEEAFEQRAAFGPGVELVNVVTGERFLT